MVHRPPNLTLFRPFPDQVLNKVLRIGKVFARGKIDNLLLIWMNHLPQLFQISLFNTNKNISKN